MVGREVGDVEGEVAKVEAGDYSSFDFSRAIMGSPMQGERSKTSSAPIGESPAAPATPG